MEGFFEVVKTSPFNYAKAKMYADSIQWSAFSISMAYVVVIFGIKFAMKDRKPFEFRLGLQLWNLWLAVFSIVGALVTTRALFSSIVNEGFSSSYCKAGSFFQGTSGLWSFLFCLSKIAELGDTLFIVLRKRPLMFLHWYHHVATLNYGILSYADGTAFNSWIIWLNFSVHAIMYSYYFLAACKIRAPAAVAQCITFLQITQFIITHAVLFHVAYLVLTGQSCDTHFGTYMFCLIMELSYVYLFGSFFYQSYIKNGGKKFQKEKQQVSSSVEQQKVE
jgi:elongation of very long chain fatty acids protein 6